MDRRRFLKVFAAAGAAGLVVPLWWKPARAALGALECHDPLRATIPETARAWRAMGTLMEVRVPDLPPDSAVAAIRAVRRRVEELEAAMTLFRTESPLVTFNRLPAGRWMRVPLELAEGVAAALEGYAGSGGLFDPTVVPAMRAWGLYDMNGRVPPGAFFREWRRRPRAEAVEADERNRRLRRLDGRVEADLGGVGKGMAVDEALALLRKAGSRAALVNLGGSIGVLGAPAWSPEGWPVGIADPANPGEILSELSLASGHLATSGIYERSVNTPAGRKHHLLDPVTGEPVHGVNAVTVYCASGVEADLSSTVELVSEARRASGSTGAAPVLFQRKVISISRS